jgi:putative ABC transport system permease protein
VQGQFLSGSGQALLSDAYAAEKGIKLGDRITLLSNGGLKTLIVSGMLSTQDGVARLNNGDLVVMSLDDATALHGSASFDTLSILPAGSANSADLTAQLRRLLPAAAEIQSPNASTDFQNVIGLLMAVISLMVLSLGSFLIYNTMSVTIAQRRSEIGVLRALGMTRAQVRNLFTLEAAILGLVGAVIGVGFGIVLVRVGSNLPVIPQNSTAALAITSTAPIVVPPTLIPIAILVGTLMPTIAGYLGSRAAANIDPVEAMIQIRAESGVLRVQRWHIAVAGVLLAGMLYTHFVSLGSTQVMLMVSNTAVIGVAVVIVLILPAYIIILSNALPGWMYRVFGITGMIAANNVIRRPKRTLATIMLMTIGIAFGLVIAQSNFGYSEFMNEWQHSENIGELTVTGANRDPLNPLLAVPASIVDSIKARPDIAAVIAERDTTLQQGSIGLSVRAIDMAAFRVQGGRFLWDHGDEAMAYYRLQDAAHPAILVGAGIIGINNGFAPGVHLTLNTPSGPTDFEIVGVVLGGTATDKAIVIMDRALYSRLWQDDLVNRVTLKLQPNADVQSVRRDLLKQYAMSGVVTLDNAELREAFGKQITSIVTVSRLLSVLFYLILAAGQGSTLLVNVIDRRREIGMLRAVGMLRRQMSRGIVLEAVTLVAVSGVIAVPGSYLMTLLQQGAMQQIVGIRFAMNGWEVVGFMAFMMAIAIAAAYFPARHAGRTNVLDAMRYE